jgi:hypothetical protein
LVLEIQVGDIVGQAVVWIHVLSHVGVVTQVWPWRHLGRAVVLGALLLTLLTSFPTLALLLGPGLLYQIQPRNLQLHYLVDELNILIQKLQLAIGDILDDLRHLLQILVDPRNDKLHLR